MEQELITTIKELINTLKTPRAVIPADKQLWDASACAEYLHVSSPHFSQRIACLPDFPRYMDISTGTSNRSLRWNAKEVMLWAEKRKAPKRA